MDVQDWVIEANAIVREVAPFVDSAALADVLNAKERNGLEPDSVQRVFINLRIREGHKYTILLGQFGFKVVANQFDHIDAELEETNAYFETPFALLQSLSPKYTQSFGEELIYKLDQLSCKNEWKL